MVLFSYSRSIDSIILHFVRLSPTNKLSCLAALLSFVFGASISIASEPLTEEEIAQPYGFRPYSEYPVLFPVHPTLNYDIWESHSPSEDRIGILDESRAWVAKGVEGLNDSLDVFFTESFWGDQIDVDEDSGSTSLIRLYTRHDIRPNKTNVGIGVNLKLVLANTNERLKLVLTSDEDEEQDGGLIDNDEPENDVSAALRLIFNENNRWKTSFDNGVRWRGGFRAFTQFRVRYKRQFTTWHSRFVQRVFWENIKGQGYDASWDLSRPLGPRWGLSTSFDGEILKDDGYWNTGHSWRLTHLYSSSISMRLSAGVTLDNEKGWKDNNFFLFYSWRKRIYQDFVYFEIRPGLDFPREEDYVHQPSIYLSLDYLTF